MKGIILAGGQGTRLQPMTNICNKHLLPVYDKPMIDYPLQMFPEGADVLLVSSPEHIGDFARYLGDGDRYGMYLTYAVQPKPLGILDALWRARHFYRGEAVRVCLGDQIFLAPAPLRASAHQFENSKAPGCLLFWQMVPDIRPFGELLFDAGGKFEKFVEKPREARTGAALTGLFCFDPEALDYAMSRAPVNRPERGIGPLLDVLWPDWVRCEPVGGFWADAGTPQSLLAAANAIAGQ